MNIPYELGEVPIRVLTLLSKIDENIDKQGEPYTEIQNLIIFLQEKLRNKQVIPDEKKEMIISKLSNLKSEINLIREKREAILKYIKANRPKILH